LDSVKTKNVRKTSDVVVPSFLYYFRICSTHVHVCKVLEQVHD